MLDPGLLGCLATITKRERSGQLGTEKKEIGQTRKSKIRAIQFVLLHPNCYKRTCNQICPFVIFTFTFAFTFHLFLKWLKAQNSRKLRLRKRVRTQAILGRIWTPDPCPGHLHRPRASADRKHHSMTKQVENAEGKSVH